MEAGTPAQLPRNPLRAWISGDWWLALIYLLTGVVTGSVGAMFLVLLGISVLALPLALTGALLFAATIP